MKGCWSLYSNNKSTVCLAVFSSRTLKQNKAKSKIAEDNIKHLSFPLLTFEIEIISKGSNPKPTEVSGKTLLTHACLFLTLKLVIPASYFFFFFFQGKQAWCFLLQEAASQVLSQPRYVLSVKLATDNLRFSAEELWDVPWLLIFSGRSSWLSALTFRICC